MEPDAERFEMVDTTSLPTKRVLTMEAARAICDAALAAAASKDIDYLAISVVDDGGHLLAFVRQSGAEAATADIGVAKARTAATTRKPTQWWTDHLHSGTYAFLGMPGVTPVGGAHPIRIDGRVVGAVSAAGGSFEVDNDICQCAMAIIQHG